MAGDQVFNIAIVGSGGIGGTHAGAAEATKGAINVVAAIDTNHESASALANAHTARAFESVEQMLTGGERPDGIVVCTPPSARLESIERALGEGIAVLAEKPLAHTRPDAEKLARLAEKHPEIATAVGFCHRFTPAVVEMKKRVGDGAIGRMTRFENTFATYFEAMRGRWFSDPELSGGGSFLDTGCHSLDLFRFLVGDAEIAGIVMDHPWEGRGEAGATALLRCGTSHFGSAVAGVILSGWLEPDRFTLTLAGTGGLMHYDYLDPEKLVTVTTAGERTEDAIESHDVRFRRQLEAFASATRGDRPADLASFADGLAVAENVESALNH